MYNNIDNKFNLWDYSRGNNARAVEMGRLCLYFSYKTVIAYSLKNDTGYLTVGRVNEWGPTTGRHMNDVSGNHKEDRLTGEDFQNELETLYKELGL